MINIIIFSLNRAAQLELLLRSMKKHFKEFNNSKISILYKVSNEDFRKGYNLIPKYENITLIEERNFKGDLINILNPSISYTMFLMDDNVFKEDFSLEDDEVKYFKSNDNIISLSLRLHPNLTYCYPARINMNKPKLLFNKNIINWRTETGDYGYPMSLDGNLWRTNQILNLVHNLNYNNPNSLESQMAFRPLNIPFIMFYNKSKIINIPINKVQNFNNNVHGNISADYLNKLFLNNQKISMEGISNIDNISCHQEIKIKINK